MANEKLIIQPGIKPNNLYMIVIDNLDHYSLGKDLKIINTILHLDKPMKKHWMYYSESLKRFNDKFSENRSYPEHLDKMIVSDFTIYDYGDSKVQVWMKNTWDNLFEESEAALKEIKKLPFLVKLLKTF